MYRIWNYIPRVVRQPFHGPRASVGACVEEEKAEQDVEKCFHDNDAKAHDKKEPLKSLLCLQYCCGRGYGDQKHKDGAHHDHSGWWKRHCHDDFWSHFCPSTRSLEAVTWGAAIAVGLQLSRHPSLQDYLGVGRRGDRNQPWRSLLFRLALNMPPDTWKSGRRFVLQPSEPPHSQAKPEQTQDEGEEKPQQTPAPPQKSLGEAMQDFSASCQQYTAVGSSIAGVLAAEEGRMKEALQHLHLASQLGHAPAHFNLALCYHSGRGVDKDPQQAASYYSMAAESGHAQSIFNLALMTLNGEGVTQDKVKAMQLMNKAADEGLAQAQTYLGVYYTEDDDSQQDFSQAASYFSAAASQNDAEGQYFLGICYENGWGVESSDEEAARCYSAASKSGHHGATYNLAAFVEYGLGGLECSMEEAMALYRTSADQGNDSAKFRIQEAQAKSALEEWAAADQEAAPESPSLSPGLRRTPHSSSPSLTDYVRQSLAAFFTEHSAAWTTAQTSQPRFTLGENQEVAGTKRDTDLTLTRGLDCPFEGWHQSDPCWPGLLRTATMPELRVVPCP